MLSDNSQIADRFAVNDVLYTYCALMDEMAFDEMAQRVFTADAVESHGLGLPTVRGREEIAAFFSSLLSPFEGTMHTVGNIQLQWEGEGRIRSRSYFQAYHWLSSTGPDPQRPADLISTGVYLDDFRLTPDGWRINSRQRRNVGPSPVGVGRLPARLQGLGGAAQPDQL